MDMYLLLMLLEMKVKSLKIIKIEIAQLKEAPRTLFQIDIQGSKCQYLKNLALVLLKRLAL